jgi:hypothetical protein
MGEWNEQAWYDLFETVDGPVGRDLNNRGLRGVAMQKRLLSQHGSGRVYTQTFFIKDGQLRVGGNRPPHQASAPGEPPATDTGRLRAALSHYVTHDEHGLRLDVGSGANPAIPGVVYAIYLELGWVNVETGTHAEPRPFIRPSMEALR